MFVPCGSLPGIIVAEYSLSQRTLPPQDTSGRGYGPCRVISVQKNVRAKRMQAMNNNQFLNRAILFLFLFLLSTETTYGAMVECATLQEVNGSCSSCQANNVADRQGLAGTGGMPGDLVQVLVVVNHPRTVTGEEIAAAISRLGYPARVIANADNAIIQNSSGTGQVASVASRISISNCNRKSCSATASAWKELYRRYFANIFDNATKSETTK